MKFIITAQSIVSMDSIVLRTHICKNSDIGIEIQSVVITTAIVELEPGRDVSDDIFEILDVINIQAYMETII